MQEKARGLSAVPAPPANVRPAATDANGRSEESMFGKTVRGAAELAADDTAL